MRRASRHLVVAILCMAALWVTHPAPLEGWFDTTYVAHRMLTASSFTEAARFYTGYHTYPRPARTLEWWVGAHLAGEDPARYHALNVFFVGLALWALIWLAGSITGSRGRGYFVGVCMAVSYVSVYPILHFPYGIQLALALAGFAALVDDQGRERTCRAALGTIGILIASLAHEVFLTFTVLPWLYHRLVRPLPRWAVAACFAGLPAWIVLQVAFRSSAVPRGAAFNEGIAEHVSRVVVSLLSAGLPSEMLRVFPIAAPFTRLRESLLTGPALLLLLAVSLPTLLLLPLALWRPWTGRTGFLVLWLLGGSVPLLLPVGTPESYHLAGALPALFLLWTVGFDRLRLPAGAGTAIMRGVACAALVVWMGVHGFARAQLFYVDLPFASQAAHSLRTLIAASSEPVVALFAPAQVGGHYGYWPALPAQGACLLEPSWIWRVSRLPSLPSVCRGQGTIVVGPMTEEGERAFRGAREMLRHPTSSAFTYRGLSPIMAGCPVRRYEVMRDGDGIRWRYTLDGVDAARVVRLRLTPAPTWVSATDCS